MTDLRLIGLVSAAHFGSHFFQLALPPLFPVLKEEFGVSYVALAAMMTLAYATGGAGQTVAGFLVDRFGARGMLLLGLTAVATAVGLAGLAGSYAMLLPVVVLGALGNSVFHPADYAIFNAAVDPRRLGRAYSVHGIAGSLGFAASPAVIATVKSVLGWRGALVAVAVAGLCGVAALAAGTRGLTDHRARAAARTRAGSTTLGSDVSLLLTAPIVAAFAYFTILATATIGIQTFSVAALVTLYEAPLALATTALTGYLIGKSAGILLGGLLADRTRRHDVVAGTGMLLGSLMILVVASALPTLPALVVAMALAGFAVGTAQPSRDMLVRAATPAGASGKVFGFVYSGLDVGATLTSLVFGWLLDRGEPRALFVLVSGLMLLTIGTVVEVRRRAASLAARS